MRPALLAVASLPLALTLALGGCSTEAPAVSDSLGSGSECAVKWKAVGAHGAEVAAHDQATIKLLNEALVAATDDTGPDIGTVATDWKAALESQKEGIAMLKDGTAMANAATDEGC